MDLESLSETGRKAWVVWSMVLFVGVAFWAFRPKKKKRLEKDGTIPFADDEDGE